MAKKIVSLFISVFIVSIILACDKAKGKNQYYQNPGNSYSNISQNLDTKRWKIQQLEFQIQQMDWKIQQESKNLSFYKNMSNNYPSMANAQLQYNSSCLLRSYLEEKARLQSEKNQLEYGN